MIKFDLQVSLSFLEALLPYLGKVLRETSGRFAGERFALPKSGDEDLNAAWREGLIEDGRADRLTFSRLLGNPKLAQGQVEHEGTTTLRWRAGDGTPSPFSKVCGTLETRDLLSS